MRRARSRFRRYLWRRDSLKPPGWNITLPVFLRNQANTAYLKTTEKRPPYYSGTSVDNPSGRVAKVYNVLGQWGYGRPAKALTSVVLSTLAPENHTFT